MVKFEGRYRRRKRGGWIAEASLVSTCRVGSRGGKQRVGGNGGGGWVGRWVDGGGSGGGGGGGGGGSGGGGGGDGDGGVGWFQCSRGRSLSHTDDSPRRSRRRDGSRNRRRKRARGKYGRAVAARRSVRRFGKLDSPATNGELRSLARGL
ncbi:hypothetical protein G5I_01612 [Acromyrmex echinatior]|uniref:Uncharacterized protein n=1 Tax=Acromyrmex echinatior TaxID=103372 RepID=F4W835_ACREC|nr:hypothetical protein G5I_01612 [Acromyrmex echinatior]